MIKKLELKNFRCFDELVINEIKPLTLIAGKNGTGKTTILESIFFLYKRLNANAFFQLNGIRGLNEVELLPQMVWEPLFREMQMNREISIKIITDDTTKEAILGKDHSYALSSFQGAALPGGQRIGIPLVNSYPLKMQFKEKGDIEVVRYFLTDVGVALDAPGVSQESSCVHYLSSRILISPREASELLGRLDRIREKSKCINILKLLNEDITDLAIIPMGGVNAIFADLGLAEMLPVHALGDGISKLLSLALVMLVNPGAILLIDEIENGFHYSFFPKLWDLLGKIALQTQCQVIATTHNYDCISGAFDLASGSNADLFCYIRLDRAENRVVAKAYDGDSFTYALQNSWEVR